MTDVVSVDASTIDSWADDPRGPVALHLKQKLLPVEGEGAVIFPPTYADIGYNIDTLSDGSKVAVIDSVGSQANRIEPIFAQEPYRTLIPQICIEFQRREDNGETFVERRSILDLAHRGADAVVHSCPTLAPAIRKAFSDLRRHGDAGPLCRLAPTSLVFGVWDSRGGSGEKRPRLIRATIRAWDVDTLHAAAQFNSVWKALDSRDQEELEKEASNRKTKLSEKGFADAPAIFRKVSQSAAREMREFRNGSPNLERRVLGGVITRGPIERNVTINLVALRAIRGSDEDETRQIRRYLLGLALVAATADLDLFLREGCHLRFADDELWEKVPRRGALVPVDLSSSAARKTIREYADDAAKPLRSGWPSDFAHKFDLNEAKKLLAKKTEDEGEEG
jgi:CRISPR-associated protein Csb1